MNANKNYIEKKLAEFSNKELEKKELFKFFKSDSLINMTLKYQRANYCNHSVTVFYFDLYNENNELCFNYIILYHTTNYFEKGNFKGSEISLLKFLKEKIIDNINNSFLKL